LTKILRNHYVLAVHDKKSSAEFYESVLGFEIYYEDEGWIFVAKDNCSIMIDECPGSIDPNKLGDHSYFGYLMVDDADSYFNQIKLFGANIIVEPENKPWGMREFGIKTPDGHRIMIGEEIK